MDAVRETHTVPSGSKRAEEFSKPRSFVYSAVSCAYFPCSLRMSGSASQGTVPPHHSGRRRLGVCPDCRSANERSGRQFQPWVDPPNFGGPAWIGATILLFIVRPKKASTSYRVMHPLACPE